MSVQVRGCKELENRLRLIEARLHDLMPVTTGIAMDVASLVNSSLGNGQSPDGQRWPPKADRSPFETAGLAASTTVTPTSSGFVMRSTAPYAGYWQDGTGRQPARPFLPIVRSAGQVQWMRAGPAGEILKSILERISRHVLGAS